MPEKIPPASGSGLGLLCFFLDIVFDLGPIHRRGQPTAKCSSFPLEFQRERVRPNGSADSAPTTDAVRRKSNSTLVHLQKSPTKTSLAVPVETPSLINSGCHGHFALRISTVPIRHASGTWIASLHLPIAQKNHIRDRSDGVPSISNSASDSVFSVAGLIKELFGSESSIVRTATHASICLLLQRRFQAVVLMIEIKVEMIPELVIVSSVVTNSKWQVGGN